MPAFLKKDSIRLIEAAREFYIVSLYSISLPSLTKNRAEETRYAPLAGMLGAAVELAIKSCLVQAKGKLTSFVGENKYKQASACLDEFKKDIKSKNGAFSFLWDRESDADKYIDLLQDSLLKFRILIEIRAAGLHNGYGPSYDASVIKINDVHSFFELLARCKRLKPYIMPLPNPIKSVLDRFALIEDLNSKISNCSDQKEKAKHLQDLYLILPYVPEEEPDWVGALNRIQIAPKKEDLTYLVKNLSKAHPIHLYKNDKDGDAIAARFDNGNPNAISVEPQHIKKEFTRLLDIIRTQIASANGTFRQGVLTIPSYHIVIDLFIHGISRETFGTEKGLLTANDTWPFVVSALSYQGTTCPVWFIVQECKELNKLITILDKVKTTPCVTAKFKSNYSKIHSALIDASNGRLQEKSLENIYNESSKYIDSAFNAKNGLLSTPTEHTPSKDLKQIILRFQKNTLPLIDSIKGIEFCEDGDDIKKHYVRKLISCAVSIDDAEALQFILTSSNYMKTMGTLARKALKAIDVKTCTFFDAFQYDF